MTPLVVHGFCLSLAPQLQPTVTLALQVLT
jgi:hypothetical protein